jgi:hypothetical protein
MRLFPHHKTIPAVKAKPLNQERLLLAAFCACGILSDPEDSPRVRRGAHVKSPQQVLDFVIGQLEFECERHRSERVERLQKLLLEFADSVWEALDEEQRKDWLWQQLIANARRAAHES